MAGITYDINANTSGAINPIRQLQTQVQNTTKSFDGLKSAIAAIGVGAAIRSALNYADAIQDISDASGLAIANITGFSRAVELNGGNAEQAQQAILRLSQSVGQAAQGSLQAQDAFRQIGITLQDLATLSDQELFDRTLQGLAGIADTSRRAVLQTELLGKGLRGVNLQKVAAAYGDAARSSQRYQASIAKAAEVQNKLDMAFGQLRLSILKLLEPFADFINKLEPAQIERFIDGMVKLAAAGTALAAAVKGFKLLTAAIAILGTAGAAYIITAKNGIAGLALTLASAGTRWNGFIKAFQSASALGKVVQVIKAIDIAVSKTIPYAITNFLKFVPVIGGVIAKFEKLTVAILAFAGRIAAVATAVIAINDLIKMAFNVDPIDNMATALEKLVTRYFPKLAEGINNVGKALGMAPPPSERGTDSGKANTGLAADQDKLRQATEERLAAEREMVDALERQRRVVQEIAGDYKKSLDNRAADFTLQTDLIGKTEEQQDLLQALNDLRQRERDEIDKLIKAQQDLSAEQKRAGFAAEYDRQIAKVRELSAAEQERLTLLVQKLNQARAAEALRQFGLNRETQVQSDLRDLERQRATLTLTGIAKLYADIELSALESAAAAIAEENARRGVAMSLAEEEQYRQKAMAGTDRLKRKTRELYDESRRFDTGWKRALGNFVENARDAASQAERLFAKFTSGIEDLIVDFAKTGRFEWRQFVAGMLEDLLRANIQQTMASVLQMPNPFSSTGGSISDMFGGLFGGLVGGNQQRGQSANAPLYVLDVSGGGVKSLMPGGGIGGGTGGGIVDTVSNIYNGVKNTIGNVASGISNTVGNVINTVSKIGGGVWDTVKSVGSSLWNGAKSLFGFANGGIIPTNRPVLVGERGPEILSGAAGRVVTPNDQIGGTTNVTYNINAVDARSFQQLLAQDPTFIFALTEQGRKSYAGAR